VTFIFSSGPSSVIIKNNDRPVATVEDMVIGPYKFKLSIKDNEGLEDSSTVSITVNQSKKLGTIKGR